MFLARFERVFDQTDHAGSAGDRFFVIQQGARSVANYSVEFEALAVESN